MSWTRNDKTWWPESTKSNTMKFPNYLPVLSHRSKWAVGSPSPPNRSGGPTACTSPQTYIIERRNKKRKVKTELVSSQADLNGASDLPGPAFNK